MSESTFKVEGIECPSHEYAVDMVRRSCRRGRVVARPAWSYDDAQPIVWVYVGRSRVAVLDRYGRVVPGFDAADGYGHAGAVKA